MRRETTGFFIAVYFEALDMTSQDEIALTGAKTLGIEGIVSGLRAVRMASLEHRQRRN